MNSDWLSPRLTQALGLIPMRRKGSQAVVQPSVSEATQADSDALETAAADPAPQLDKHEFRLLVNMLKAIGHDCQYDHISYDGKQVKYRLDSLTLVFNDLSLTDDAQHMNLASLTDIIRDPKLKRPVWEKLKTLNQA
jgi:hypothetical protein